MSRKPKIVLYRPQMVDRRTGEFPSYDQLPLEMLHIAAIPDAEGYEVKVLDANLYEHDEAHRMAVEWCSDAAIFGTTAILGYTVADGHMAAEAVRAAYPDIKIITGGWFPSVAPEQYLKTGIYDAVAFGQGEMTFRDFVHAVDSGVALDEVKGLGLWRDNQVIKTAAQPIVGWSQLKRAAWHLMDPEPYRERQMRPGAHRSTNHMPIPPRLAKQGRQNYFGITYFSSFGCPEPCIFCCSPSVTDQRWKAQPADDMLDDLQELHERWGFESVRFHDANFGVHEKRIHDFSQGIVDRKLDFDWNCMLEIYSTLRYSQETLDLFKESGMYVCLIGAEAAEEKMLERLGKPVKMGDSKKACKEYHERGITVSLTYIIGYPGESEHSMRTTLDEAGDIVATYPLVSAQVFPFRPIPGSSLFDDALKMGYVPPEGLDNWGKMLQYHVMQTWKDNIPPEVEKIWRLYYQYSSFFHGMVRPKRGLIERISGWRLKSGNYSLPIELKLFYFMDRLLGRRSRREDEKQSWIMSSEHSGDDHYDDAHPLMKAAHIEAEDAELVSKS